MQTVYFRSFPATNTLPMHTTTPAAVSAVVQLRAHARATTHTGAPLVMSVTLLAVVGLPLPVLNPTFSLEGETTGEYQTDLLPLLVPEHQPTPRHQIASPARTAATSLPRRVPPTPCLVCGSLPSLLPTCWIYQRMDRRRT
ncbi:uncharacterized protein LOC124358329 [Homalodisca vitripennis]|uniref:uncharacterized protein LOC124358329 n=1 Tax=Homalodisca vitripennis TaxID=197043 RepID=UPI001EEBAE41|nr:uncharacterized protein LOC124358329 [Homalodisca vitripennis]